MNELQIAMQIALANTYIMYFKSASYHWNVEGFMFHQFHDFFGNVYEELHEAIDPMAEHIRALGGYGPTSLVDMLRFSTITEDLVRPTSARAMLESLQASNTGVIDSLNKAFMFAEQNNDQGLLDFIAGRLASHSKHGWQLAASLKSTGE